MAAIASALGTIQEGRAAEAQGKAQKRIAEINARNLEVQADAEKTAARLEEERVSRQQKATEGKQKTAFRKSGTTLEGTPTDLLADQAFQFELERNLVLRQGLVRAVQRRIEADIMRARGKQASAFGKFAKRNSILKASIKLGGAALGSFPSSTPGSLPAPQPTQTGIPSPPAGGQFT